MKKKNVAHDEYERYKLSVITDIGWPMKGGQEKEISMSNSEERAGVQGIPLFQQLFYSTIKKVAYNLTFKPVKSLTSKYHHEKRRGTTHIVRNTAKEQANISWTC